MNNSPRGNGFDQYAVTIETHCLNRHTITADTDEGVSGQEGMGAKDPTPPKRSGGSEGAPEGAPPCHLRVAPVVISQSTQYCGLMLVWLAV